MKERGISFNAEMVLATLALAKTQTRRTSGLDIINERPNDFTFDRMQAGYDDGRTRFVFFDRGGEPFCVKCRYGEIGDRLWAREAWNFPADVNGFAPRELQHRWLGDPLMRYQSDGAMRGEMATETTYWGRLRNARFMPRWASRITLEITDIRVQAVNEISEEDAVAEGVCFCADMVPRPWWCQPNRFPKQNFLALFESINKKKNLMNPYVFALTFRVLEGGADES